LSEPIAENAAITREGPVTAVSVPATIGLGTALVHALDYVVALQVMFDIAAGNKATPVLVWERLKARGIRSSKNAAELVGRNAVYESFGRLGEAGHLRRVELPNEKHPGRKGPVAYQWFENAAWNPDWQAKQVGTDPLSIDDRHDHASENPQVRMLPRTPEAVSRKVGVSAGQNASPNAGSGVPGSGVPGSGGRRIPAGQNASPVPGSGSVSPPHPPEEEGGTTSPNPQKPAAAPRRGRGRADARQTPDVPADAAAAAALFLRKLPGSFAAGVQRSESLAPWLVHNAGLTGWELDLSLRMYLTRPETGKGAIVNHGSVLAHRIMNLQDRDAVLAAEAEEAERPDPAPAAAAPSGVPDWCGQCNDGEHPAQLSMRLVPSAEDDDAMLRCPRCHPATARKQRADSRP
jgi:hypothetical protein